MELPYTLLALGMGAFTLLYVKNHTVRYYAKHTFFAMAMTFSASVYIPLMLRSPRNYKNALLPAWTLRQVGRLLKLKFTVRGTENIVRDSGCVILVNHQSVIDMLVLAHIWPVMGRCTVIAKKEIFYMWPFGLATWLWGTIFIDRLSGDKARMTINSTGNTIRENRAKLCMFPEGTRYGGESLLPFKKGAFHVAISSQCPLQPVVVSQYYFLDYKKCIFDSGEVTITILPAIPTEGLSRDDIVPLIDESYRTMNEAYQRETKKLMDELSKR